MTLAAWERVTETTIQNCWRHALSSNEEPKIQPLEIEVPEGFTRDVWEAQIDMEDICDEEVEEEIQEIVEKGKSMAADAAEPVEDNLISVPLAMTAARRIRSLLQTQGAPQDVMNGLRAVVKQLLLYQMSSRTAKQANELDLGFREPCSECPFDLKKKEKIVIHLFF